MVVSALYSTCANLRAYFDFADLTLFDFLFHFLLHGLFSLLKNNSCFYLLLLSFSQPFREFATHMCTQTGLLVYCSIDKRSRFFVYFISWNNQHKWYVNILLLRLMIRIEIHFLRLIRIQNIYAALLKHVWSIYQLISAQNIAGYTTAVQIFCFLFAICLYVMQRVHESAETHTYI